MLALSGGLLALAAETDRAGARLVVEKSVQSDSPSTPTPRPQEPTPDGSGEGGNWTGRSVTDFLLHARLKAECRLLEEEVRHLEEVVGPQSPALILAQGMGRLDPRLREPLLHTVQESLQRLASDLSSLVVRLHEDLVRLQKTWELLRQSIGQQRQMLQVAVDSRKKAAQPATLLSADERWFWLFGAVAVGTLLGMVLHDRRRELRVRLRGGRVPATVLSLVLTLTVGLLTSFAAATFVRGDRARQLHDPTEIAVTPSDGSETFPPTLAAELALLHKQQRQLSAECRRIEDLCREKLDSKLPPALGVGPSWMSYRQQIRAVAVELSVLENVSPAFVADRTKLDQIQQELIAERKAIVAHRTLRRHLRAGLGATLLGLTTVGGVFFCRGLSRRRRQTADTCPLCLGRLSLREEATMVPPEAEGPPGEPPRIVRCRNLIGHHPPEECNYRFSAAYRPMPKLSFPTMGVPQAGKTHWLAMLYWTLNRGTYPASIRFEKVRSESSEDFDTIVEEILRSRIGTAATQRERIPHPVVFNCNDRDRWGRAHLLLNLFDYSGEVTLDLRADDHRRRRALEADGFLFFLDPTFPAAPQAQALADFREDLRLLKGVRSSRKVRTPMALCVSKIDLLPTQSYAMPGGGDSVAKFYEELTRIDPTGESFSLRAIEARSRLVASMRETIWPGWEIERQMRDLFGGRFLFFPMTPVGLEGCNESDLSLRTISPYAILEPLMWLLHMNGYCILRDY